MLTLLLASCVLAAPPTQAGSSCRLSVRVAPAEGEALLLDARPSCGKRSSRTISATELEDAVGRSADESQARDAVLTLDTRLPLSVGASAVSALKSRGVSIELRFAGATKLADGGMPPVLSLIKEVAIPPPLSREELAQVAQSAGQALRSCYGKELSTNALQGELRVAFVIAADGTVSSAEVRDSQLGKPEIDSCIAETVKKLQFPKLRGAPRLEVTWPFRFERGEPPVKAKGAAEGSAAKK